MDEVRAISPLQSRDPFSGDCDQKPHGDVVEAVPVLLQSRDPFSGDCDVEEGRALELPGLIGLQSRDPFSGDCDFDIPGRPRYTWGQLAEPRPVPRGLRQGIVRRDWGDIGHACRAETRSQGIATLATVIACCFSLGSLLQSRDPFSGDCDVGV